MIYDINLAAQRVWTSNTSYDPQVYETKRVMGPVELLVKDPLVRPFNKVLLLVGPPGLGKTTLAHIIAAQCGYSAIEMNASDDRAPEVFKAKLETVLNIQSISFGDNRPKCLIVDEIDGAHAGAVKALILRLQEAPQTKKRKKSKTKGHLKRPIICICNNLYAPALRPLRNVAHILRVTDTSVRKLVHRLNGICRRESLIVDTAAMTLLCDMAGSDVRTSLNTLQFLKRKTKHLTVQDIRKSGVGQKDSKLALRALWSSIFRKPSKRKRNIAAEKERGKTRGDSQMVDVDDLQAKVLRNIRCHGDYNFLVNGCMENYLTADYTDAKFHAIPSLLDWVGLYDTLNTTILTTQNYQLMGYMPYSVYAFHHHIAGFNELPQYNLPTQDRKHIQANSDCTLRELKAHKLVSASLDDLILDYTPSLLKILNPPFKNSRVEYLTANQKAIVENLVNCMVLYGLDFIPKRSETGQFVYELQPDLLGLSHYVGDGFGPGPELPDDIKKHVSNQASIERTRRIADAAFGREGVNAKAKSDFQGKTETDIIGQTGTSLNVKPKSPRSVLSIDQKLKDNSRTIPTKAVVRDFFGRIIEVNDDKEVDESDSNSLGSGTRKSKSTKSAAPGVWLTYNQGRLNCAHLLYVRTEQEVAFNPIKNEPNWRDFQFLQTSLVFVRQSVHTVSELEIYASRMISVPVNPRSAIVRSISEFIVFAHSSPATKVSHRHHPDKMPHVLVCCDSFKETATADEVNSALTDAIQSMCASVSVQKLDMSDGGEGFVSSLTSALDLTIATVDVKGPLLTQVGACYGINEDEHLAVIELATASGLESVPVAQRDPLKTSTVGLGELLLDAYNRGCRKVYLGIGGSATNDAGLGALQVLGLEIITKDGVLSEIFCGRHLTEVVDLIVTPRLLSLINKLDIHVACDVTNPFVGSKGAVAVFSKQKGADEKSRRTLERGMMNVAGIIQNVTGICTNDLAGAGAAGGVGGTFYALLNAKLLPGVEMIANCLKLEAAVQLADVVFTGEGSYDSQTADGKVVSYVQLLCKRHGKPSVVVCGRNQLASTATKASNDLVWDLVSLYGKDKSMNSTVECLRDLICTKKYIILTMLT
eukprot:CFRG6155T1